MGKILRGYVFVFVLLLFASIPKAHAELDVSLRSFIDYQFGRASRCVEALLGPRDAVRLGALSQGVVEIKSLIEAELDPAILNQHLRAFYGAHHDVDAQGNPVKPYNMRPWAQVPLSSIQTDQVVGMTVEEFVAILQISTEIEIPIHDYQAQSGKAFEFLLPTLARFMGRTPEQQEYSLVNGRAERCDSVWCSEENRHGAIFARIIEKLTGQKPDLTKSAIPNITSATEAGALRHLSHRQGTEWGATSAYVLLAIHSRGPLREAILNVLRDEVKHLVVVSAADLYLRGLVPNQRTVRILEKTLIEVRAGAKTRTGGNSVFKSPFNLAETGLAQIFVEGHMRRFLASLPLNVLREIYEGQSQAMVPPALPWPSEVEAERTLRFEQQRLKRHALTLWPRRQRIAALAQEDFEQRYQALIDQKIKDNFAGNSDWRVISDHNLLKEYVANRIHDSYLPDQSQQRLITAIANRLTLIRILERTPEVLL